MPSYGFLRLAMQFCSLENGTRTFHSTDLDASPDNEPDFEPDDEPDVE